MADELFQLSNGRYITSEEISRKMFYIKSVHPELPYQENSTGYSWDEAGMADLFGCNVAPVGELKQFISHSCLLLS